VTHRRQCPYGHGSRVRDVSHTARRRTPTSSMNVSSKAGSSEPDRSMTRNSTSARWSRRSPRGGWSWRLILSMCQNMNPFTITARLEIGRRGPARSLSSPATYGEHLHPHAVDVLRNDRTTLYLQRRRGCRSAARRRPWWPGWRGRAWHRWGPAHSSRPSQWAKQHTIYAELTGPRPCRTPTLRLVEAEVGGEGGRPDLPGDEAGDPPPPPLSLLFRRPWTRQFVHEQPSRSSTPVPVPRTAAAAFEEYVERGRSK
jgi:hypothetical protein